MNNYNSTHWSNEQVERLQELMADSEIFIGFAATDVEGISTKKELSKERFTPGLIQFNSSNSVEDLQLHRFESCYHATHRITLWSGLRVWMVALFNPKKEANPKISPNTMSVGLGDILHTKQVIRAWSLKREILGEILLPEACFDEQIAAKLGHTDLSYSNFRLASLDGIDLNVVNTIGSDLTGVWKTQFELARNFQPLFYEWRHDKYGY